MTTATQNGVLTNFDFDVDIKTRRGASGNATDAYVTIGAKGRVRKASNHTVSFSKWAAENELTPKMVAFGKHRALKNRIAVVFDNAALVDNSFKCGNYEKSNQCVVNSANAAIRIFELCGVEVPERPDTSTTLRFNLEKGETEGMGYMIPVSVTKYDATNTPKTFFLKGEQANGH